MIAVWGGVCCMLSVCADRTSVCRPTWCLCVEVYAVYCLCVLIEPARAGRHGACAYQWESRHVLHSHWPARWWNWLETTPSCTVNSPPQLWHGTLTAMTLSPFFCRQLPLPVDWHQKILSLCPSAHLTVLSLFNPVSLNLTFSLLPITSSHPHASASDSAFDFWRYVDIWLTLTLKLSSVSYFSGTRFLLAPVAG